MGIYSQAIQRLYVAYFNRPADPAGVIYWDKAITAANGSMAAVSAAFAASGEYKDMYAGMDVNHVVGQVYQNLFGHAPDLAGLNYWVQLLSNKQMTIDNVVTQIAGGAQGSDLVAFNSKTAAASAFSNALQTASQALAYTGSNALAIGKFFIASVVDDATLKAAIDPVTLQKVIDSLSGGTPWPVFHVGIATNAFDASALAPVYGAIDLPQDRVVVNVGSQVLIAHGNLTATAAGYDGDGIFGGNLQVREFASATVTANADALSLSVQASTANVATTLAGDTRSASVKLGSDDPDFTASFSVATSDTALAGMKSLAVSGSGVVNVSNGAGSALTAIDASALAGPGGLTYSSANDLSESIRLGTGIDHLTLKASTYAHMDSIDGLRLVLNSAGTALTATSDTLAVGGVRTGIKVFTTTQTDLDLALMDAAASGQSDSLVFVMNGNTYIYHDTTANHRIDFDDIVVKLTGVLDLKALIVALGAPSS